MGGYFSLRALSPHLWLNGTRWLIIALNQIIFIHRDQAEDSNHINEAEENFTNHLKVSQDKYLPKEDISLDDVVVTEKVTNLTTFAAQLKKVPCPVVPTLSQEITPPSLPEKEEKKVEGNLVNFSFILQN